MRSGMDWSLLNFKENYLKDAVSVFLYPIFFNNQIPASIACNHTKYYIIYVECLTRRLWYADFPKDFS